MTEYRELTYETQAYNELIPIAEDIKNWYLNAAYSRE